MVEEQILKDVYQFYLDLFGAADDFYKFKDKEESKHFPKRIDICVWHADEECDITIFTTLGMSSIPMIDGHRAELNFAIRKKLSEEEIKEVSDFLVNFAMLPFHYKNKMDWWDIIPVGKDIPLFKSTEHIVLHPKFSEDATDLIRADRRDVKIFNLIPITNEEKDLHVVSKITEHLMSFDFLTPR